MVHAILQTLSPVLWSITVSIILHALFITHSKMVLLRKMFRLLKACSTKLRRKAKIFLQVSYDIPQYPLTGTMSSPLQILQGTNSRSDMPMSNAAMKQLGIQPEVIRNIDKHAVLPLHDLHIGQQVMYQDSTNKHWYPAVIDSLCPELRSYKITTRDGITYRKTQSHLKPLHLRIRPFYLIQVCHLQWHNLPICSQWKLHSRRSHKWTMKCKYHQADQKGTLSPQLSLSSKFFKCLLSADLDIYNFYSVFKHMQVATQ